MLSMDRSALFVSKVSLDTEVPGELYVSYYFALTEAGARKGRTGSSKKQEPGSIFMDAQRYNF